MFKNFCATTVIFQIVIKVQGLHVSNFQNLGLALTRTLVSTSTLFFEIYKKHW